MVKIIRGVAVIGNGRNIILIGMPGVGKSTIGVLLAKAMLRDFIDTDVYIQHKEKKTLQDIINTMGLPYFMHVEERHILSITCSNTIIATGGSVIYSVPGMRHLRTGGIICLLSLPLLNLKERLTNFDLRGVVRKPDQGIDELFEERMPLYQAYADITIDCSNKGHEEAVSSVIAGLERYRSEKG